jgi:O-antigen/teichoic acid export membrane protein
LALGVKQAVKSLWLTAKGLSEMFRQQGIRMVLAPLSGVDQMAAFSTMRTGANFALQGLNTIAGPVMPELMRFLTARDQPRMESTFAVVWLVLCSALSPGVLIIQSVAPIVFPIWTHGKIAFDPILFAMLSLAVLVYALSIPALAVLQGNNLLRAQLMTSLLAATTTVYGMILLVPLAGIRGAALALLLGEGASLLASLCVALIWLHRNGMAWPILAFGAAATSTLLAGVGMAAMALIPSSNVVTLPLSLLIEALVLIVYWRYLPSIARARATSLASRFLPASWR